MTLTGDDAQDFSRRQLLRGAAASAAAFAAGGVLLSGVAGAEQKSKLAKSLNVLCWEGYTDPHFTKPFTEQTGVTINSTFIGSNDELVAKLRGNPGLYDLVTPSCDTTGLLIEANQVQSINLANVPNSKTTFPFFLTAPNVYVRGKHYGHGDSFPSFTTLKRSKWRRTRGRNSGIQSIKALSQCGRTFPCSGQRACCSVTKIRTR